MCNACTQEIVFFEQGEPMVDGDTGDLKVCPTPMLRAHVHRPDLRMDSVLCSTTAVHINPDTV